MCHESRSFTQGHRDNLSAQSPDNLPAQPTANSIDGASPVQSRARKLEKEILEMESDVEADVDSDVVVLDVGAVGARVGSRGQPGLEDFLNSPSPFKT